METTKLLGLLSVADDVKGRRWRCCAENQVSVATCPHGDFSERHSQNLGFVLPRLDGLSGIWAGKENNDRRQSREAAFQRIGF